MKSSISTFLVLLFSFQLLQSQDLETSTKQKEPVLFQQQEIYQLYLLKSKKKRKAGSILLISGMAAAAGGFALMTSNLNIFSDGQNGGFAAGSALFIVGSIATIVSIPVLISAGANKIKAKAFLGSENVGFIGNPIYNGKYVSVGISFHL